MNPKYKLYLYYSIPKSKTQYIDIAIIINTIYCAKTLLLFIKLMIKSLKSQIFFKRGEYLKKLHPKISDAVILKYIYSL